MGYCINHPDRETSYMCMKHNVVLCDDCLKCPDPELYCKFRSSCPIWFLQKRGVEDLAAGDEKPSAVKPAHQVIFKPDNREAGVPEGSTLLQAANLADVCLNASCNGKGACGKFKIDAGRPGPGAGGGVRTGRGMGGGHGMGGNKKSR